MGEYQLSSLHQKPDSQKIMKSAIYNDFIDIQIFNSQRL